MWDKMQKKDKIKLIYAYIVSPLMIIGNIGGRIITELYSMYGRNATQDILSNGALSKINLTAFMLGLLGYLPIAIPPTIMRFIAIRHKLKYGIEIYCYMLLSFFFARVLVFMLTGTIDPTLGFLDSLVIYCILSFRTTEYREIPHSYRYGLTFLTIGAAFVILYFTSEHFTSDKQYLFPIWEAIALCLVLNRRTESIAPKEPEQPYETQHSNNINAQTTYHQQPPEPPHREIRQEPKPPQSPQLDIADTLIDIGLAHIGRTTALDNPYITPEQTEARKRVERPFLRVLADNYRDEQSRKILARHFMVYKEVSLFMAFAFILKRDKELHNTVRERLKELLSQGLLSEVRKKWDENVYRISRTFYDEYKQTRELSHALKAAFCETVPEYGAVTAERLSELCDKDEMQRIFMYSYDAVLREYRKILEQT